MPSSKASARTRAISASATRGGSDKNLLAPDNRTKQPAMSATDSLRAASSSVSFCFNHAAPSAHYGDCAPVPCATRSHAWRDRVRAAIHVAPAVARRRPCGSRRRRTTNGGTMRGGVKPLVSMCPLRPEWRQRATLKFSFARAYGGGPADGCCNRQTTHRRASASASSASSTGVRLYRGWGGLHGSF